MRVILLCMLMAVILTIKVSSKAMMREDPEMVEVTVKVPKEMADQVLPMIEEAGYDVVSKAMTEEETKLLTQKEACKKGQHLALKCFFICWNTCV